MVMLPDSLSAIKGTEATK